MNEKQKSVQTNDEKKNKRTFFLFSFTSTMHQISLLANVKAENVMHASTEHEKKISFNDDTEEKIACCFSCILNKSLFRSIFLVLIKQVCVNIDDRRINQEN